MSLVNMVDFVAQYLAWIRGLVVQRGSYEAGFVGRTINFGSYLYRTRILVRDKTGKSDLHNPCHQPGQLVSEITVNTFANRSTDTISNFQNVDLVVP